MEKRYLIISWTETREKNHSKSGSDMVYDFLVEKGMSFKLLGLSGESFVKEANDNEIIIDIASKNKDKVLTEVIKQIVNFNPDKNYSYELDDEKNYLYSKYLHSKYVLCLR